jgi:hypothetical protein
MPGASTTQPPAASSLLWGQRLCPQRERRSAASQGLHYPILHSAAGKNGLWAPKPKYHKREDDNLVSRSICTSDRQPSICGGGE